VTVSVVASKSAKTAIERQSKEVSLARTNNFLGIYGSLVSICLGMSGKRRERIASRMEQARVTWRSAAWHVIAHDSTSQALAWTKQRPPGWGLLEYYRQLADIATGRVEPPRVRLKAPPGITHVYTLSGQQFLVQDGYVSVAVDDASPLIGAGFIGARSSECFLELWTWPHVSFSW
jgi:hypothetical protein